MSTGTESPPTDTREPAAPPTQPSEPLLYGAGQSAWLAVVTAVAFAALIVALLALWMNRSGGGGATAAAPAGGATVEVDGGEFFFDPEAMTATAGDVEVVFNNVGNIDHEWVALTAGTEIASEGEFEESMVLHRVPTTAAGESSTESFAFEAGEYQIICTIPGHFAGGMHGTLTVE